MANNCHYCRMKPILFNTVMVRAILDGRKTVTRRAVKPQPENEVRKIATVRYHKPYCPGDILYVRETWTEWSQTMGTVPRLYYRADGNTPYKIRWRPSIHMPREAARLFLRVTNVRMERLQDMKREDCANDGGFEPLVVYTFGIAKLFAPLWNSTLKKSDRNIYGWDANPWVWVIEFERISKEEVYMDE